MQTIGERLRFFREKKTEIKSRKEFVKGLGITERTLERYENDVRSPDAAFLTNLYTRWHMTLDMDWLLTGSTKQETTDAFAHIPLYDVRASAGGGAYIETEQVTNVLAFRKEWIANELRVSVKDLVVLFVEGDSMTPTLNPGDIMLVVKDHGLMPQDGVYIITLDGTLLVKRLQKLLGGKLAIQSDNPNYRPLEVDLKKTHDDFHIIGRVVWAGRRF